MTLVTLVEFFVPGVCKGQPRVRAYRKGNHASVYTPKNADDWAMAVYLGARENAPESPIQGPVFLSMEFSIERPKSHWTGKGALRLRAPVGHCAKPDLDNMVKLVKDVLTAAGFWRDDSQVTGCCASKAWRNPYDPLDHAGVLISVTMDTCPQPMQNSEISSPSTSRPARPISSAPPTAIPARKVSPILGKLIGMPPAANTPTED